MIMKTTLEQWRMFKAVVDHGGYAQASEAIHKSQSTISYGVHKLQQQLGVQLLEVEGRKALLTAHGKIMLQRGEQLLEQADNLDRLAASLEQGVEPSVRLAIDMIYPHPALMPVLEAFAGQYPDTRIELDEFVLGGGLELLSEGKADLLISTMVPSGTPHQHIERVRFLPVSHPQHPLQQLGRPASYNDLSQQRQVVVKDSARKSNRDGGWLGANQRWTVSHASTSLNIIRRGLAFAWLPQHWIEDDLQQGLLAEIPLDQDASRYIDLYLVLAGGDSAGPACRYLAGLFAGSVQEPAVIVADDL